MYKEIELTEDIKELARAFDRAVLICLSDWSVLKDGSSEWYAKYLYKVAGYRKQREGKWIKAPCSEKDGDATCSVCGHWDWSDCNYCSNCGAKVIKKEQPDV